jgi:hypothetical protein
MERKREVRQARCGFLLALDKGLKKYKFINHTFKYLSA